ncbi:unnamed protein product [marine sediment metagenome]|uniref:Uncharacterized protein n=1 Tax=marine sediment metagenome TaxID=412755 RepID=X1KK15_9ZZZZ
MSGTLSIIKITVAGIVMKATIFKAEAKISLNLELFSAMMRPAMFGNTTVAMATAKTSKGILISL